MRWLASLVVGCMFLAGAEAQDLEILGKKTSDWLAILKNGKEVKLRRASLIALEAAGPRIKGVVDGVSKAVTGDDDADIRREAALTLGRMAPESKGGVPALAEALARDKEAKVREAAAQAMGGGLAEHSGDHVAVLARALKDSHVGTQNAAAEALKNIRGAARAVVKEMIDFSESPKSENVARRYTLQALSRLTALTPEDQESVLGSLVKVAKDGDVPSDVREAALEGLGYLKSEKSLPGLMEGMKATDKELRRAAIRGLALLKDKAKDAWPAIQPALKDTDSFIRNQAIQVSGHIGKELPEAVKALILSAEKDGELENRITAIQALGELGKAGEPAVTTLETLAKNDVRLRVREAAGDAARKIKKAASSSS